MVYNQGKGKKDFLSKTGKFETKKPAQFSVVNAKI